MSRHASQMGPCSTLSPVTPNPHSGIPSVVSDRFSPSCGLLLSSVLEIRESMVERAKEE